MSDAYPVDSFETESWRLAGSRATVLGARALHGVETSAQQAVLRHLGRFPFEPLKEQTGDASASAAGFWLCEPLGRSSRQDRARGI